MGTNYDEIKQFELSLQIHSYKYFDKQVALFEEMMELFLEPLDEVTSNWQSHYKDDERSSLMFVLVRMFNDYESSRLMLLNGFPEQAVMPMRDAIECTMLFRLFSKESKYALRWVEYFKEYKASIVKTFLDELEVDCPEYAFYGMFSEMVHPNLLSVASKVTEKEQTGNTLIRTFHFGGMNRPTWTEQVFNHLLALLLMTLLSVLLPIYARFMKNPEEWQKKVLAAKDRLVKFGAHLHIEKVEKTGKAKAEEERVFKKFKLWRIEAELEKLDEKRIAADKGFPNVSSS
jgi:hypothetical protein